MRAGQLKRATFIVGFVVLLVGAFVLIDPVARAGRNCGSAILPKRILVAAQARVCQATLRERRVLGVPILAVGTVAVAATRFRCLVTPDGADL